MIHEPDYYSYKFPSQIWKCFHNALLNWVEKGKDKENTNLQYQVFLKLVTIFCIKMKMKKYIFKGSNKIDI